MLPSLHRQQYLEFKHILKQMEETVVQRNDDRERLEAAENNLRNVFQNQILSLDGSELAPEIEQRVQSFQIEIDKQLRLLKMDLMFLRAARQAVTNQQRRNQLCDRLTTLIRYCDALLEA